MQEKPEDELRKIFSLKSGQEIDQGTIVRLKARMAQEFREQLLVGAPSNADEEGLRRLSRELRSGKLVVKLFLRYKLHAKLYLFYQHSNPITHSDFWKNISAYLLGPNFNVMPTVLIPAQFKANSIGIPPLVDVDGTHTLLVTLGYAIIFAVVAVVLTWRRDVKE